MHQAAEHKNLRKMAANTKRECPRAGRPVSTRLKPSLMITNQTLRLSNRSQLARLDKVLTVQPDSGSPINIVMLYDNDETREWTKEAHARVLQLAGEQSVRP